MNQDKIFMSYSPNNLFNIINYTLFTFIQKKDYIRQRGVQRMHTLHSACDEEQEEDTEEEETLFDIE